MRVKLSVQAQPFVRLIRDCRALRRCKVECPCQRWRPVLGVRHFNDNSSSVEPSAFYFLCLALSLLRSPIAADSQLFLLAGEPGIGMLGEHGRVVVAFAVVPKGKLSAGLPG